MDLYEAEDLAEELMKFHGLDKWTFGFDRAKQRCGQCQHSKHEITLSRYYAERNDRSEVQDTILHEIAHALVGSGEGHSPKWRVMARAVGAKPQRCADASVSMPKARWELVCTEGHSLGERHRRSVKLDWSVCGRCRSPLVYVPNV